MSHFTIYRIGRGSDVDIRIDDNSVSRLHAELVVTESGSHYLTDCASTNGSYVAQNGEWIPIRQDFITPTDVILLGQYRTTVPQLIAMAAQGDRRNASDLPSGGERKPLPTDDLPKGPVKRRPGTGEIIKEEN